MAIGFSARKKSASPPSRTIDEDLCFEETTFVRATTIGAVVPARGKEKSRARSPDSPWHVRRHTSNAVQPDDDEGDTLWASVSETRKAWQTSTSTVLKATGRKNGANNALVSQVAALMQDLQGHFDRQLEDAVKDIKKSIGTVHNMATGSYHGVWERVESRSSLRSEDKGTQYSIPDKTDDEQYVSQLMSEKSMQVVGDISSSSRGLQLPEHVVSHIQNSGCSMQDIQRAQEEHFLGILREKRRRKNVKKGSESQLRNTVSPMPRIHSEGALHSDQLGVAESEGEYLNTIRPLSMLLLHIWGVLAWSQSSPRKRMLSFIYQTLVLMLALCAAGLQISDTVTNFAPDESMSIESVGYLIVSIGASLGLIQAQRLAKISEIAGVLATEGTEKRLFWGFVSYNDVGALFNMVAFALIVVSSVVRLDHPGQWRSNPAYLVRVIFLKGLLCSVNFFVFLVAHAMQMTAEGFCRDFMRKPHFGEAIEAWASIETMLHKLCKDLAAALLTLVLTALSVIVTFFFKPKEQESTAQLDVLSQILPLLILPVYVLTTISQAAEVTETCTRVPPLINSLNFGVQLDVDRLYLVQYIVHSGAGFHFNNIRLTGSMVTKAAYVMGLLMFSVLTGASLVNK